jgi:hypothetical protein
VKNCESNSKWYIKNYENELTKRKLDNIKAKKWNLINFMKSTKRKKKF